ncbi:hypothetical protein SAMN05443572_109283 [Myxococcus fulvus]|uniref:Lipoprotein n=1 Tax=Myxococcus fulvus TaxID=33 RepID=A0A511T636_MYXFU|nr:hypothetical protein MFU01_46680 [Myxococcus fulvus]SEU33408.1 hypothetical protein SAMN05443572_109283 [Myxococcus fulvus]
MNSTRIAAAVCILTFAGTSLAGARYGQNVHVDTALRYAFGAIGAARNSSDYNQALKCGISATPTTMSGYCIATNAQGEAYSCSTNSPNLVEAIKHVGESSYVRFHGDEYGNCIEIVVENASYNEPKR